MFLVCWSIKVQVDRLGTVDLLDDSEWWLARSVREWNDINLPTSSSSDSDRGTESGIVKLFARATLLVRGFRM